MSIESSNKPLPCSDCGAPFKNGAAVRLFPPRCRPCRMKQWRRHNRDRMRVYNERSRMARRREGKPARSRALDRTRPAETFKNFALRYWREQERALRNDDRGEERANVEPLTEEQRKLVEKNLRLVGYTVSRYFRSSSIDEEDLVSEGMIGLMRAAQKYDPSRGAFSTVAVIWIRQQIGRYIQNHRSPIRVSVHIQDSLARIRKAREAWREAHGTEPTPAQLAEQLSMTVESIENALDAERLRTCSLSAPISRNDEDGGTLGDLIPNRESQAPDASFLARDRERAFDALLDGLDEREALTLRMRYEDDLSWIEIGLRLGMTGRQAQGLATGALDKLRLRLGDRPLKSAESSAEIANVCLQNLAS